MNYHKIEKTSIANGVGVRCVLWVSGCSLRCKGCHNPQTWAFDSGNLFDDAAKQEFFEALDKSYIKGCTFSGGHPLEYENLPYVYVLVKECKERFPEKDIWLYTGYTLSMSDFDTSADICCDKSLLTSRILAMCDVVVDGPYVEELRDITLAYRGSKNQRLIDVKQSIKQNEIVLYEPRKE